MEWIVKAWKRWSPPGLLVCATIACVCCYKGVQQAEYGKSAKLLAQPAGVTSTGGKEETKTIPLDALLFRSVQMLLLNFDGGDETNGYLRTARVSALAFVFLGVVSILAKVHDDSIYPFRIWYLKRVKKGKYVVVCGLGMIGMQVVRDCVEEGTPVIVIEKDPNNVFLETIKNMGALKAAIRIGNAADNEVLEEVGGANSEAVYAVTGSDLSNIEIALDVRKSCGVGADGNVVKVSGNDKSGKRRLCKKPTVYIHYRGFALADFFDEEKKPDRVNVEVFHAELQAARIFVRDELCSRIPDANQVTHVVLIGLGKAGQAVSRFVADMAHFTNLKRPRMTIVGATLAQRNEFEALLPRFGRETRHGSDLVDSDQWAQGDTKHVDYVVNVEYAGDEDGVAIDEVRKRIPLLKGGANHVSFVCCTDDETRNLELASELREVLFWEKFDRDAPIYAYVPLQTHLADHFPSRGRRKVGSQWKEMNDIHLFGSRTHCCSAKNISPSDEAAKALAEKYNELPGIRTKTAAKWDDNSRRVKDSNRLAADHAKIKLACIDVCCHSSTLLSEIGKHREQLAQVEHNRWVAERLLRGWSHGPRDDESRTRATLCAWEHVGQSTVDGTDERDKDRESVDMIPVIARMLSCGCRRCRQKDMTRKGSD